MFFDLYDIIVSRKFSSFVDSNWRTWNYDHFYDDSLWIAHNESSNQFCFSINFSLNCRASSQMNDCFKPWAFYRSARQRSMGSYIRFQLVFFASIYSIRKNLTYQSTLSPTKQCSPAQPAKSSHFQALRTSQWSINRFSINDQSQTTTSAPELPHASSRRPKPKPFPFSVSVSVFVHHTVFFFFFSSSFFNSYAA